MAVLAAILPLVSQSSALALVLYRLAAADAYVAKDLLRTAKAISNLALIVKEIGTIIKEDDRLPSAEAFETIEDVVYQSTAILDEIDSIVSTQNEERYQIHPGEYRERDYALILSPQLVGRLHYLKAHLDSLRTTLSVMLQTLYTAQSIMWARVRPTVSPRECATAVANEKQQLETLIIDQQMSILLASKLYERARPDARLLMEDDNSLSLSVIDESAPKPSNLVKYQDRFIVSLDTQNSDEEDWLASVCGIANSQVDRLLERWTRLRQFEEDLLDAERKLQAQKREAQQPFVESDSEDHIPASPKSANSRVEFKTPMPRKSDAMPPLFTETQTLPIPIPGQGNISMPSSPRSSISTPPVEAAAAVEAKDKDDDVNLEIPWTLRTRKHFWKYIDGKVSESNTDLPTSEAFAHRSSWTEVQASWVCKEALQEANYSFTQVQKDIPDGRRTKFETWFCIDQPMTFDQIQRLVERTVELYRKSKPPSPPPTRERKRRTSTSSSYERRFLPPPNGVDRDRTPLASPKPPPPPLDRSTTAYHIPQSPSLDRSISSPGPGPGSPPAYPSNPRHSSLQSPPPSNSFPHPPPYPSSPRPSVSGLQTPQPSTSLPKSPSYSPKPQAAHPNPHHSFPPPRTFAHPTPFQPLPPSRHLQPPSYSQVPPLRTSLDGARHEHHSSASGTSDSEGVSRSRKHRSRSRRRGSDSQRRKRGHDHGHGKTKALMGVAGLTALLDGLVGI